MKTVYPEQSIPDKRRSALSKEKTLIDILELKPTVYT